MLAGADVDRAGVFAPAGAVRSARAAALTVGLGGPAGHRQQAVAQVHVGGIAKLLGPGGARNRRCIAVIILPGSRLRRCRNLACGRWWLGCAAAAGGYVPVRLRAGHVVQAWPPGLAFHPTGWAQDASRARWLVMAEGASAGPSGV